MRMKTSMIATARHSMIRAASSIQKRDVSMVLALLLRTDRGSFHRSLQQRFYRQFDSVKHPVGADPRGKASLIEHVADRGLGCRNGDRDTFILEVVAQLIQAGRSGCVQIGNGLGIEQEIPCRPRRLADGGPGAFSEMVGIEEDQGGVKAED